MKRSYLLGGAAIILGLVHAFEYGPLLSEQEASGRFVLSYLTAAIALVGFAKVKNSARTSGHKALIYLSLLLLFPFGVIFSGCLLIFALLWPPPPEGRGELGQEEANLFRLNPPTLSSTPTAEVFLPAISLLESTDIDERRAAIDVLAQIGGPEQVRHLQACLGDPEREVYQYAHAKITGLHERYTDAVRSAQATGSRENLLDCYLNYLHSGLLGEATAEFYRQKAVVVTLALLKEQPHNVALLNLLAKLYLSQGAYAEAKLLLDRSLINEADSLEAHWLLAQIDYEKRDFENLQSRLEVLGRLSTAQGVEVGPALQGLSWWVEGRRD